MLADITGDDDEAPEEEREYTGEYVGEVYRE